MQKSLVRKGMVLGIVYLMIGAVFSGLINTVSATDEKLTISVTDPSPWFTKGSYSGHPEYWNYYPDEYEPIYIWTYVGGMSGNPSQPDCWAEFHPYLSQDGEYDVYACFYADPQNSHIVPHTVYYDGGSTTILVDQYASDYFTWREVKLGTWNFNAGAGTCVVVTDATGESYDGYTTLNADTIMFVSTGGDNVLPTVDAFSVSPLSVTLGGTFTISYTVSDEGGSGLKQVELWRKSTGDWEQIEVTSLAGVGNGPYSGSFYDTPSSVGTYWYGIHVVDNAGNWAPEDSPINVEVTSPPVQPPGSFTLTGSPECDGANPYNHLSWTSSSGATSYDVYRDGAFYYDLTTMGTTFDNTMVTPGTTYQYFIRASNAAGNTDSNTITITTNNNCGGQLPTVQTQAATNIGANTASINGFIIDLGGSPIIERRFDWGTTVACSDGWTNAVTVNGDSFSYVLNNLQPGVTYYFRAWAKNSVGWGQGSVLSFTTTTSSTFVNGIDVSQYQGTIDWDQVYNAGIRFAFVKATAGDAQPPQLIDPNFVTNMNSAHNAGVLVGAYHYAYPQYCTASDEAHFFVSIAGSYITSGYLRPVLDLEEGGGILTPQALSAWVHTWMNTVESLTGVEPILYVNSNYATNYLDTTVTQYDLWIAHWTCNSQTTPDIGPWSTWRFWQYYGPGDPPYYTNGCGLNTVLGVEDPDNRGVDLDVFNGNQAQLNTFVIGGGGQAIPTVTSSLTILQSPPYYVGDTITAQYTIENQGTAPITFDILTVGGRDPDDQVADFTFLYDIVLIPGDSYYYQGNLMLTKVGNYHFFCAYKTLDGNWNTAIPTENGVTNVIDITVGSSGSGSGTSEDPYQITNCAQLQEMKNNLTAHYKLMNDIDCAETVNWNGGAGFEPIGTIGGYCDGCNWCWDEYECMMMGGTWYSDEPFTGTFDGQGYKIVNLFINRISSDNVGLFGYTENSEIKNVGLINADITGQDYVGCLAGYKSYHTTITNSYATGSITGNRKVGGLVGYNDGSDAIVDSSYSNCDVIGNDKVGGLVGHVDKGTVNNSYATGNVNGNEYVGGLVGMNDHGVIFNSYSIGGVNGNSYVGGLVGINGNTFMPKDEQIYNSFATGDVSGTNNVGGLVGHNDYLISNCYWNNHTGNPDVCVGSDDGSTDCTTIQNNEPYFQGSISSRTPMSNWDFPPWYEWTNPDDYPKLEPRGGGDISGSEIASGTLGRYFRARKLARTSDGDLHCVYNRSDGLYSQIYHSYSTDDGETWNEEPLTSASYDQIYPAIAVDSNDYIHVVWQGCHAGSPDHPQIRYKKYTMGWGGAIHITTDTGWDQRTPAIAVDSNDSLHVVWQKIDVIGGTWCQNGCGPLYYSEYTDFWSTPVRIGEGDRYNEEKPSIAIDGNDYVHVAWTDGGYMNLACWHSAYRRYTTSWQPIESFECYACHPSIAVDSQENVHFVSYNWPYTAGITYRKRTASGWSIPEIIEPDTPESKYFSIAMDSNDYLHVVWSHNGDIKYRKKTSSWQDTETIISDTDSTSPHLIWSWHPVVDGVSTNIPENGFAFVWNDGSMIKFYKSADLEWEGNGGSQPPVTTLEFGAPQIIREWQGIDYYVIGPNTPVRINSSDVSPGTERIEYSVWVADDLEDPIVWTFLWSETMYDNDENDSDETFGSIVTEFYNDETCLHEVRYQCWDCNGATEGVFSKDFFVDKCGPITTKVVGCPTYSDGWLPPWASGITPLTFNSVDNCCLPNGTAVEKITIKVWWKPNPCDSSGALNVIETIVVEDGDGNDINPAEGRVGYEFHFTQTGYYELEYWGVDMMGNIESHHKQQHRVDVEPPETLKSFEGPTYPADDYPDSWYGPDEGENYWVKSTTEITLTAEDREWPCDVGVVGFNIKVEWDPDCDGIFQMQLLNTAVPAPYTYSFTFKELVDNELGYEVGYYEGDYKITWSSFDCLGNTEEEKIQYHRVDDTPPTCIVELQKDGVPIDEIDVGEFFDICVTEFSGDIQQIRFLSDEDQNGIVDPGFTWTDWYDWYTSTSDWTGIWDANQKIKTWAFATGGTKEVWAEVNDTAGKTSNCSANIYAYADLDGDGIDDLVERDLAKQYFPILYFDSDERCYPTSIIYHLNNSDLWKATYSELLNMYLFDRLKIHELQNSDIEGYTNIPEPREYVYMDNIHGTVLTKNDIISHYENNRESYGDIAYVHVKKDTYDDNTYIAIQYWFFYAFNDGINNHEGDWEMVQVLVDEEENPLWVVCTQHNGGERRKWNKIEREGTHPKIYVAYGSHANYFKSFWRNRYLDTADGNGDELRFEDMKIEMLGERYHHLNPHNWLDFAGCWGEWWGVFGSNGPQGPMYRWDGDCWDYPAIWGLESLLKIWLSCPANLTITDNQTRKIGYIDGEFVDEIPGASADIFGDIEIYYLPLDLIYTYEVRGYDEGTYNFTIINEQDNITVNATDIPIFSNEIHQYTINWTALSQGKEGVTIKIDSDGDGTFEKTITSDEELTQVEFILQTETIIDIDPDTLNLKSKGKWITCYIELPDGYDVADIDISTILLNDIVPAEDHPTNIGDYDNDGIPDLMVKFDRQAVQAILEPGENVAITVTGKLFDETMFEGTDYIRVI